MAATPEALAVNRWTVLLGPNRIRHATLPGEYDRLACDTQPRVTKYGDISVLHSHEPYDPGDVACKRCRRKLGIGPRSRGRWA